MVPCHFTWCRCSLYYLIFYYRVSREFWLKLTYLSYYIFICISIYKLSIKCVVFLYLCTKVKWLSVISIFKPSLKYIVRIWNFRCCGKFSICDTLSSKCLLNFTYSRLKHNIVIGSDIQVIVLILYYCIFIS